MEAVNLAWKWESRLLKMISYIFGLKALVIFSSRIFHSSDEEKNKGYTNIKTTDKKTKNTKCLI